MKSIYQLFFPILAGSTLFLTPVARADESFALPENQIKGIARDPDVDALMAGALKDGGLPASKILTPFYNKVYALIAAVENTVEKSPVQDMRKDAAIFILGEMRHPAAVKVLVNNLAFMPKHPGKIFGYHEPQEEFPCAVALIKMGSPAVDSLLSLIAKSESVEERNLAAWVLMKIDGPQVALFRLQSAQTGYRRTWKSELDSINRLEEARTFIKTNMPKTR